MKAKIIFFSVNNKKKKVILRVNFGFCYVDIPVRAVDDDETSPDKLLYEHIRGIFNGLEMFDRSWIKQELDIGMVQLLS